MTVTYSSKAKTDLVKLDWKIRHKIIHKLGKLESAKQSNTLMKKIFNSDYYRIDCFNQVIICEILPKKNYNIITVVEKKEPKFPE